MSRPGRGCLASPLVHRPRCGLCSSVATYAVTLARPWPSNTPPVGSLKPPQISRICNSGPTILSGTRSWKRESRYGRLRMRRRSYDSARARSASSRMWPFGARSSEPTRWQGRQPAPGDAGALQAAGACPGSAASAGPALLASPRPTSGRAAPTPFPHGPRGPTRNLGLAPCRLPAAGDDLQSCQCHWQRNEKR